MSDLQIVIPSYRRMARQSTLSYLPPSWAERTTLVVDQEDANRVPLYRSDLKGARVMVCHPEIKTIAEKRAWIIRHPDFNKIVMFDDDLRFAVRINETDTKLRQSTHDDLDFYLRMLDSELDKLVHAGWSARQGNNNVKHHGYVENTRMMFVLGYDCATLRDMEAKGQIQLGRVRTREDMELTLQLLKLGYVNSVDFRIAADQVSGYAAKGGCSDERTVESSNADAEEFAALHPGLVRVVEKAYKGSVNRKEVVVSWKKAFKESQA